MSKQKKGLIWVSLVLVVVMLVSLAFAAEEGTKPSPQGQRPEAGRQDRGGGERTRGGGQREGGFDRASMQERMLGMMKERVGATDDEWTIIKPRLEKVMELSRNAGGMRGMFGRGRSSRGDRGSREETEAPTEPVQIAADDLQKTLDKEAPSAAEIKAKLAALRGAREKNKQELVIAQQKLKEILTVKQEALLVMMGMLE